MTVLAGAGGPASAPPPLRIAIVAGEPSGDQLGFKLMRALRELAGGPVAFIGVGGERMTVEGLQSLFPIEDIAVMGVLPVVRRLPLILRRLRETTDALAAARPDALVIVDSPDFTHRVARGVRARLPHLPVVNYVSPSVWAWRTGRARKMRAYVDHVLALLPFEPDAHRRLGGPPCSYVGHPLIERLGELRPDPEEQARRAAQPPILLILPGSRRSEIRRLMPDFGAALGLLKAQGQPFEPVLPAVDHLVPLIEEAVRDWPVPPRIVRGEAAKLASFRCARAALAASGTVTLELALAGVPMAVAYKVSAVEMRLRFLVKVHSIVLPNLVTGGRPIPEFLGPACTPASLAAAVAPLLAEGPERQAQREAMAALDDAMRLPGGEPPSRLAAQLVLSAMAAKPSQPVNR